MTEADLEHTEPSHMTLTSDLGNIPSRAVSFKPRVGSYSPWIRRTKHKDALKRILEYSCSLFGLGRQTNTSL